MTHLDFSTDSVFNSQGNEIAVPHSQHEHHPVTSVSGRAGIATTRLEFLESKLEVERIYLGLRHYGYLLDNQANNKEHWPFYKAYLEYCK
ncbi:hypothetical protein ElyMa_000912800 [Elysia marginata]|uniref:Uncharacterized protein n=1 Tax=Elysia marginata TaxID=1093978 RepID=A0AAV4H901_9GAST|nr:hypothetical protein ElyMa_000912800 [Elysia marginata]